MAETYYAWNPVFDCITKEVDAAGATIAEYTHEPKLYGGLISQHRGGVSSVYHYDAIGTTRALTNNSQTVTDTAVYAAFGEKVASAGGTTNPFGYLGAVGYCLSGALASRIDVRFRNYSPDQAHWLSPDPRGFSDGPNRYSYSSNRGTIAIDPSGLACSPAIKRGANYVPGRGNWILYTPAFGIPGGDSGISSTPNWVEPMWISLKWKADPLRFFADGCCCCDEIGFVQIIKSQATFRYFSTFVGFFQQVLYIQNFNWKVDGGIRYGWIPYPGSPTAKPCAAVPDTVTLWDRPGLIQSTLIRWKWEAESCVVCLKGKEGLYHRRSYVGGFDKGRSPTEANTYITVYDCARWGFTYDQSGKSPISKLDDIKTGPPDLAAWLIAMRTNYGPSPQRTPSDIQAQVNRNEAR